MDKVELASDDLFRQVGIRIVGRIGTAFTREKLADTSLQNFPSFSRYLSFLREFGEIAVCFAELPIPSRFICNFSVFFKQTPGDYLPDDCFRGSCNSGWRTLEI